MISDPTLVDVPTAIAVDPPIHKIFWVNQVGGAANTGTIAEANEDGTEPQDLSTGSATVDDPQGIAIDPTDNKIFWANVGTNTISYADLSNTGIGGNLTITGSASPVNTPVGLAVDPVAQKIYWADAVLTGHISSANLNGSDSKDLSTTGASAPSVPAGVAIDPSANKVYWANKGSGKISEANLDGTGDGHDLSTSGASASTPYFVALLEAPLATGGPEEIESTPVGTTLTCPQGSWAPDLVSGFLYRAPFTYADQWTLNGEPITGATSPTYTPTSTGTLTCQVTASNHAGSTTQTTVAATVTGGTTPPPASPPKLTSVSQSHSRWREGTKQPTIASARPPVGTTFRFTVNEPVMVRFAFMQGRSTRGTLSFSVGAGAHKVAFQGRLPKRKKLATGRYTLVITVTGTNGKTATKTLTFTIVKG